MTLQKGHTMAKEKKRKEQKEKHGGSNASGKNKLAC